MRSPNVLTRVHATVAVVVKDRREQMVRCLDAVLGQDYPSFEVLVIDNCSADGTAHAVRERAAGAPVKVRVEVVPGTVGHLRNTAVALADGDVLAFTDSDCAPEPGWLSAGVAALGHDRRLGVVQGCTLPDDAPPGRWPATQSISVETGRFECCNLFFRLEAIRGAAGFDADMQHFTEDTAAGWSVLRRGWRSTFTAEAVVRHDVTYPGLVRHLRWALNFRYFPKLVRQYPEARARLCWGRWFLSRRHAGLAAAAAGVTLAPFRRSALVLVLPYAWFRTPKHLHRDEVLGNVEGVVYDLAGLVGLAAGSAQHRRLVL